MISTGMFGLDDMLGGGIPKGSRVLYSMESGVDGQLFMISALSAAIAKGYSCLVILPNTTVDAFQHDVAKMRKGELDLSSKKICFIDTIDRERIQRSARSPEAAEQGWQARIAKICREKQVEIVFAYFDLLYEEFGLEKGLKMLISTGDDPKPTLIIEHLNLEGSPLLTRFIDEFSFDLVIAIRSSILPLPHFNYFTLVHTSWLPTPARSVPFLISDGRIVPYIPRIVVTGPAKSGKSTFVANASEQGNSASRTGLCSDPATVAMDLGWLRWNDFDITLYGTPGEPRFDLVIPPVLKHTMGVVLVIDATSPDTMARAKRIITMVAAHRVPFVIAANKKDLPDLMSEAEIRKSLGILEGIPLFFISATRKADVIFVLESLVDYITQFAY